MSGSEDWFPVVAAAWQRGQSLGSVGPGPVDAHLEHSRLLAEVVGEPPETMLDLGTGGGIPGLALAGWWSETACTLLDASDRRLQPVRAAVEALGWSPRVTVVHARAESAGHDPRFREQFALVIARLFGPPATTAECAAPFARPGGRIAVTEPPETPPGSRWAALASTDLGLGVGESVESPLRVQWLDKVQTTPGRFPRRDGVPRKRPLFD